MDRRRAELCADPHLEGLLGWSASGGSRHHQCVRVPSWVCEDDLLSVQCLQGLIETDGSIYTDRGYRMVIFSTVIAELAQQVDVMIRKLGFRPHLYKVRQERDKVAFKYQVRLSRDVAAFLRLVQPLKGSRTRRRELITELRRTAPKKD